MAIALRMGWSIAIHHDEPERAQWPIDAPP